MPIESYTKTVSVEMPDGDVVKLVLVFVENIKSSLKFLITSHKSLDGKTINNFVSKSMFVCKFFLTIVMANLITNESVGSAAISS